MPLATSDCWRCESRLGLRELRLAVFTCASDDLTLASASVGWRAGALSSSRAMTWPFSTRTPSSISTSVSVPVIWVETVAGGEP